MEPQEYTSTEAPMTPAPAEHVPPSFHVDGTIAVLLVAMLGSMFLRRIGRSEAAREVRRWLPLLYSGLWTIAILTITWLYVRDMDQPWPLAIWLIFLVMLFASISWLRSIAAGVGLAVEGRMTVGDNIRVDDVEGEIVAFGLRAIRLRAVDGTTHAIPNEKLMTQTVANLTGEGGDSACEVQIPVPIGVDPDRALEMAREIAILTPLASPRHTPEVFLQPHPELERRLNVFIRGYAFDAAYQDHYRSDVISRLQAKFAELAPPNGTPRTLITN